MADGAGRDGAPLHSSSQDLKKCDFTPIYEHLMREKEVKKNMTKEEKAKIKADKEAAEEAYKFATIDGRKEKIGNFRCALAAPAAVVAHPWTHARCICLGRC